jgi:uncharacterized surface protein with fasciclin (FAS1) repeats
VKRTILTLAAGNPQFSTLVSLVKKAGLVGALSGKVKLTVFAPAGGHPAHSGDSVLRGATL